MDKLNKITKANNREFERTRSDNAGYKFDPREQGEAKSLETAMWRDGVFGQSSSGSNNGYKWQPVSDLEWCRLFDKTLLNKRVTMSHSESYAVSSNEGKPKIKKGAKKGKSKGGKKKSKKKNAGADGQQGDSPVGGLKLDKDSAGKDKSKSK